MRAREQTDMDLTVAAATQRYTNVLQNTVMLDLDDVRQHVWVNEFSHFGIIGEHNFARGDWTQPSHDTQSSINVNGRNNETATISTIPFLAYSPLPYGLVSEHTQDKHFTL